MRIADTSTPAVVLKSVAHGGLGIVRSLGRLGVTVYTVEGDHSTPAFYSRYSGGKLLHDLETVPPQNSLERLLRLGEKIGRRSVLIPSTDYAAMFIANHTSALRQWF